MNEPLVDLNFKVSRDFRRAFKRAAVDCDVTNVEFLMRLFRAWQSYSPPEPNQSPFGNLEPVDKD
ncbi:MAG: hypothetical protein KDK75_14005 [Alphaproteobacteria bacterium]|nr:hypothetical protein [Alphaproteobacteria bacterium]